MERADVLAAPRRGRGSVVAETEEQVDQLDCFAEPHVIGEARPQSQPAEEPEPADAVRLVGTERRSQTIAGRAARAAPRIA